MTNDLISREALLKTMKGVTFENIGVESQFAVQFACEAMEFAVNNAPAVDAAPVVHGRWLHCDGKSNLWHCSECGGRIMYNQTRKTYNIKKLPVGEANKFCKHCGAKMDGEE